MICPNCNRELDDGSKFCCYCGAPLSAPAAGSEPAAAGRQEPFAETEDVSWEASAPHSADRRGSGPAPRAARSARRPAAPEKKGGNARHGLAPVIFPVVILTLAAAAAVYFFFLRSPAGLADSELTGFLPRAAVITANETDKKTQYVEYTYLKRYTYCDVDVSARLSFHYDGGWTPDPKEELLAETEDWTRLAGVWTEAEGSDLAIEITGFSNGAAEGTVSYTDSMAHSAPFQDVFGTGTKASDPITGSIYYQFTGRGDLQGTYVRVERGRGVFFNNTDTPMEKDAAPKQTPAPSGALEIQRDGVTETVDTANTAAPSSSGALVATTELNVRPEPNQDKDPLGTVDVGTELSYSASGSGNGWYQVEYNGRTGYVSADYIVDLAGVSPGTISVISATTELNVRSGPGTDYKVLTTLNTGDKMVALGLSDGWYTIRYSTGTAYVSASYADVLRTVN